MRATAAVELLKWHAAAATAWYCLKVVWQTVPHVDQPALAKPDVCGNTLSASPAEAATTYASMAGMRYLASLPMIHVYNVLDPRRTHADTSTTSLISDMSLRMALNGVVQSEQANARSQIISGSPAAAT